MEVLLLVKLQKKKREKKPWSMDVFHNFWVVQMVPNCKASQFVVIPYINRSSLYSFVRAG